VVLNIFTLLGKIGLLLPYIVLAWVLRHLVGPTPIGLNKDFEAVKNCLLYPHISNGPMEGTNNKIKMVRKRGFGRAGLELLNALLVLPWYYKDLDANTLDNESSVA